MVGARAYLPGSGAMCLVEHESSLAGCPDVATRSGSHTVSMSACLQYLGMLVDLPVITTHKTHVEMLSPCQSGASSGLGTSSLIVQYRYSSFAAVYISPSA